MAYLVLIGLFAGLFGLALLSRRRFGVLGLGLAAGAVLSQNLSDPLANYLSSVQLPGWLLGVNVALPVSALLVFSPSLLLMLSGPKYVGRIAAAASAAGYAALSGLFMLGPVTGSLAWSLQAGPALDFISRYRSVLVALLIILAVADMFGARASKPSGKHRSR